MEKLVEKLTSNTLPNPVETGILDDQIMQQIDDMQQDGSTGPVFVVVLNEQQREEMRIHLTALAGIYHQHGVKEDVIQSVKYLAGRFDPQPEEDPDEVKPEQVQTVEDTQ